MHHRQDSRREVMSWGTKVHFAYVDAAGLVVADGNWRIEYDTAEQRAEHDRIIFTTTEVSTHFET